MKDGLKELTRLANEAKRAQHPTIPAHCLPPSKYSDKTANDLTKCIVHYIRLRGGYAARINTMGTYSEKLGKFIKSGSTKGTSDVIGCFNGTFLSLEVKINRDVQSEHQQETQKQVEAAGGIYAIVRDFQSFYNIITRLEEVQP